MTTYGKEVFVLLLLLTGLIGRAQNAGVSWSAFASGFGVTSSENAQLVLITGQPFVDEFGAQEAIVLNESSGQDCVPEEFDLQPHAFQPFLAIDQPHS